MAHYWTDNVHTTALTPRDYQVELLAAACEKNIIVCLGHNSSKEFIAQKLIHEKAHQLRCHTNPKISLFLCADGNSTYNLLFHLTDLRVCNLNAVNEGDIHWEEAIRQNQVIILSPELCVSALICSYLDLKSVNLIVIDDCHLKEFKSHLNELFSYYADCADKPKILGLAGPLHSAGCAPGHLAAELEHLEGNLHCQAESASDIVTVLRYCNSPVEIVLQCPPSTATCEVSRYLRELVQTKLAFLRDHRFDPSEIYSDEFLEEIQSYPDPKAEPLDLLHEYLHILDQLGAWCADRAALNLLMRIEKMKVKTPYERHFLLLCMISSCFVQARAYCDYVFSKLPGEKERIHSYSTPKVKRLLEVLKLFKRGKDKSEAPTHERIKPVLDELDALNFNKCESDIENLQKNLPVANDDPTVVQITEGLNRMLSVGQSARHQSPYKHRVARHHRSHYPPRSGPRQRHNWYHNNDPDSLCGLIFCNSKVIAKILYNMLHELSRHDEDLSYLSVQFTVDRVADPITEAKEAEQEHRKQEEVLKRFRMHECNLLIGTAVLEEGIDLPKCNLVIRWDAPSTYRSYVQCKGKARAANAYHIIMVAPSENKSHCFGEGIEQFSATSHRLVCAPDEKFDEKIDQLFSKHIEKEQTNGHDEIDHLFSDEAGAEIVELPILTNGHDATISLGELEDVDADDEEQQPVWLQDPKKLFKEFVCHSLVDEDSVAKTNRLEAEHYIRSQQEMESCTDDIVERMAEYMEIEKMLIRKCENTEPSVVEQKHADQFTALIQPYRPVAGPKTASVNLSTAVALVNKYCAKLPSDTFTKLTPLWRCGRTERNRQPMFQYTIRLPINSPIKQDILGLPMPTRILARRMAALITCRVLHRSGELDDALQPIGKESFRAMEPDWENFELEKSDEDIVFDNTEPRPGTTKRRQYYYKRIASVFCNCRPTINTGCYLYLIKMTLECPIPEEQNTRGRKIYPPEESAQCFGILTLKKIPKISPFPIFTRSGEVKVALELIESNVVFDEERLQHINVFLNYTFTKVLRLQKYLMLFDADASDNSFFIVPTIRTNVHPDDANCFQSNGTSTALTRITVDWDFLETISRTHNRMPEPVPEENRKINTFDMERFRDAVVMPWYRNQDQPQYFYVAEICSHLSPESSFPGDNYKTFKEYYYRKYGISIQDQDQPLLDVDHTSARLNFLTPRYVNRKGVALPTSSEETKRAKRENLEQKQILVPELCTIHPFPASLWRAAVCLPCVLYRINALLLADEIRLRVATDLSLGCLTVEQDAGFEWPMLNFGWSLAEVLKKSRELKSKQEKVLEIEESDNATVGDQEELVDVVPDTNKKTKKSRSKDIPIDDFDSDDADVIDDECDGGDLLEIGTWSNEMADNIDPYESFDSDMETTELPDNVQLLNTTKSRIQYGSPTSWDPKPVKTQGTSKGKEPANISSNHNQQSSTNGYFSESDDSFQTDEEYESDVSSEDETNRLKIEFKGDNVAEAIESEEDIQKRQRQLEIINNINANEQTYQSTKNVGRGFDVFDEEAKTSETWERFKEEIDAQENIFNISIEEFRRKIKEKGMLVRHNEGVIIQKKSDEKSVSLSLDDLTLLQQFLPFVNSDRLSKHVGNSLSLDELYEFHKSYFSQPIETFIIEGTGDLFDQFNESLNELDSTKKTIQLFSEEFFRDKVVKRNRNTVGSAQSQMATSSLIDGQFSFDYQPDLANHPGPSPSIILQALTMSNANDGINLERLETIGDSFLKYAITTYLYCTYEDVHEGKLSHLRSKQVSNLNLYRLGRRKMFGESMIATKFEPHDNWLPPCYYVPKELEKALITARIPAFHWNLADLPNIKELTSEEICELVRLKTAALGLIDDDGSPECRTSSSNAVRLSAENDPTSDHFTCFIPYNLVTQHSIPDKSIADCVEALIGAYLIDCGQRGALLFMAWLGIRVLPCSEPAATVNSDENSSTRKLPTTNDCSTTTPVNNYGHWAAPKSPLLLHAPNPHAMLNRLLDGYDTFETAIGYHFRDRSYLLQAMSHASYSSNRLTDCYQRLEFLGDAVLDYLITRHLYEDPRQHSPGALTDLRSALVNNTIFASLAVRHGFHKYFRHLSPGLNDVIGRFVRIQHENGHSISEEFYLLSEEECDEAEDVEVPKALGDVFESVAGAIFLDSNMSLDTVWRIYSNMMRPEIELFSNSVPKSPIRELLELEPETAKFSKPEKLADGRRVRVSVEVFGKGTYRGIGRNYRIAKCTAAKCALRQLKKQGLIRKHNNNAEPNRSF